MAIRVYQRKMSLIVAGQKEERYTLAMRSTGIIEPEQLSEEMSRYFSLEGPEILTAVNQLYALIAREVMMGMSVKIDGLGTFYPKLQSKALRNQEDADADAIRRFSVGFRADIKLRQEMQSAKVEKDTGYNIKHV